MPQSRSLIRITFAAALLAGSVGTAGAEDSFFGRLFGVSNDTVAPASREDRPGGQIEHLSDGSRGRRFFIACQVSHELMDERQKHRFLRQVAPRIVHGRRPGRADPGGARPGFAP